MSMYIRSLSKIVLITLLSVVCLPVLAQTLSPRKHISFDEDWKFKLGHAAKPDSDFNFKLVSIFSKTGKSDGTAIDPKFDDKTWRDVQLPHDWAVELPFVFSKNFDVVSHGFKPIGGLYPQNSVGWYRKHFMVAKADSGHRYQIQFDGIFRDSKVWINGFYLGTNESGYLGVTYDITDYLNFGKENVIVVRADATQSEGWFYEGAGIYRHVWLNKLNNVHIATDGVFIHTTVLNDKAVVEVETTVENQSFDPKTCVVSAAITDQKGKAVAQTTEQAVILNAGESRTVRQKVVVNGAHLWSVDDPYLYKVTPTVKLGKRVLDETKLRFGIRTVVFDAAKGVLLNGVAIKIKGTNNHPDHAGLGIALPDYVQYYRIAALKQMGSNAYRTSHYAPTPELLDACDSLGMLVLGENRLLNSSPEYIGQFERMVKRDRSRASVFLWSIGNEEGYAQGNSYGKRIAQTLLSKLKQLDPTRTATYAADMANVFPGVNEVIPVRGFNYRQFAVADYHRDHPTQPIIGTEMGSTVSTRGIYMKDTIAGYVPDQDITAPWWASRAEQWWPLAAENPWWLGGFIWTGFDYRGEPTPYEWPNVNSHFGMMDVCGFPKNIYYYYQSWWSSNDVLHVSPHWNWKGKEGKVIDVWVNSNADNVELFLNGKSQGKKDMKRNSHLQWNVVYEPGMLEAVAYRGSKKIITKVETTGNAYKLVLKPAKTIMMSDGKDANIVNVVVVDKEGREVPDANNLIRFTLKGSAEIIGVGNGNPSSHEADKCAAGKWQRKLFNGKAQLILQAGKDKADIVLEAKAEGLQSAEATIAVH